MIDINIKNSTITSVINKIITNVKEKLPVIIVEIKRLKKSSNVGEAYIIKSETTNVANPINISISAVKYFEFIN